MGVCDGSIEIALLLPHGSAAVSYLERRRLRGLRPRWPSSTGKVKPRPATAPGRRRRKRRLRSCGSGGGASKRQTWRRTAHSCMRVRACFCIRGATNEVAREIRIDRYIK